MTIPEADQQSLAEHHISQEDILVAGVQDVFAPELPTMANGSDCTKNWDVSLLQNCTMNRMKVIARDYQDVSISANRTKPELFKALHEAMLQDDECDTCGTVEGAGQCNPSTHSFLPWWDAPDGWIMGPNNIYVKMAQYVPPGPTQPTTPATTGQQTNTQGTAPQQPTTHGTVPPTNPLRVDVQNIGVQQQLALPEPGNAHSDQLARQPVIGLGPSPSASLLRTTHSQDQLAGQHATPLVQGVSQQHTAPTNVPEIIINGGQQFEQQLSQLGAGGSGDVNPLASLQAQLDAENREIRKRQEQEFLALQQSNQQAETALRQQYAQQRESEAIAHRTRLQSLRARPATPPVRMPAPTRTTPVTIPQRAATTPFTFGNGVMHPAPHQFAATPHTQFANQQGQLHTPPPGNTIPQQQMFAPQAQAYTPPPGGANYQQQMFAPPTQAAAPPQATPAPAAPSGYMTHEQVAQLFDQRMQTLSVTGLAPGMFSTFGGSAPQLNAMQGKPISHGIQNVQQAAALGIHARPVYEVNSDMIGVEMHKIRKIMTPGDDEVGAGLVFRKMRWPHNMLQPGIPGFDVTAHKDLSYHQLMNGLLSKMLAETLPNQLDPELASKLHFTQFLTAMTFHYTHRQVLDTCREMIMAWQMKEFEWNDWPLIESRLKSIRARFQQSHQPHAVNSKPSNPKPPHGGGGNNQPAKNQQQGAKNVNGVPNSYMKDNFICIKYNEKGGCSEQGPTHANKWDKTSNTPLRHVCGGCHKKSGAEHAHKAFGCNNGPFSQLFR